jgi:hypothetical protein
LREIEVYFGVWDLKIERKTRIEYISVEIRDGDV